MLSDGRQSDFTGGTSHPTRPLLTVFYQDTVLSQEASHPIANETAMTQPLVADGSCCLAICGISASPRVTQWFSYSPAHTEWLWLPVVYYAPKTVHGKLMTSEVPKL